MKFWLRLFSGGVFLIVLIALSPVIPANADWQWENDLSEAKLLKTESVSEIYEATFEFENTAKSGIDCVTVTGITFACSCVTKYEFKAGSPKHGETAKLTIRFEIDEAGRSKAQSQGLDLELIAVSTAKDVKAKLLTIRLRN